MADEGDDVDEIGGTDESQTLIIESAVTTVPASCTTPPPLRTVFVGEVTNIEANFVLYEVVSERYGTVGDLLRDGVLTVRYPIDDVKYLETGQQFLVGAIAAPSGIRGDTPVLESKVRVPPDLFGGDAVAAVQRISCPDYEDPVRTLQVNGDDTQWADAVTRSARWRVRKVSGGAAVGFPISTSNLVDKNKIQKKILSGSASATSGATVQLPSLTLNNLVIGKNYRLHMHGDLQCNVNATGAAFSAIHNSALLVRIYYEPSVVASNRAMVAGTTQLFTASASTVTFQFTNTSGSNGTQINTGWVILEELNDTDLSTSFT